MREYSTPAEYYYRLHHVRPRFKNDVENVLGFVSFGIAEIGKLLTDEFNKSLDAHIRSYGNNACYKQKTINNWRTEIAALFGMYIEESEFCTPSLVSLDLANHTDLTKFFRNFIYSFQYPGGHLKSDVILDMLVQGITFHPGRWLSRYFLSSDSAFITKPEFCHCVLNDIRVTRDHESMETTILRINENRDEHAKYDTRGDTIRYAGDILDYMVLADLVAKDPDERYYRNDRSARILDLIAQSNNVFDGYREDRTNQSVNSKEALWFHYIEDCYKEFSRQVARLTAGSRTFGPVALPDANHSVGDNAATQTGEQGENLTLAHEKLRVKAAGREDLVHLIKRIPTHLAVGYDIKSIEVDTETDRMIEVKSSVSKRPLSFNRIHLTTNEWRVAETYGDQYFVYRLQISEEGYRLFLLRDPVRKYKTDVIKMIPRDGADIIFTEDAGEFVDLLCAH